MTTERLKSHADWLQERADNPNTVAPGSPDPRSIVDSKRLGEIARDIREFVEDVEDAEKVTATLVKVQETAIHRGSALIAVQERCMREIEARQKYGIHGGGGGPELAKELMDIIKGTEDAEA